MYIEPQGSHQDIDSSPTAAKRSCSIVPAAEAEEEAPETITISMLLLTAFSRHHRSLVTAVAKAANSVAYM